MSKDSWDKYYQNNKDILPNKALEGYQILSKAEKEKKPNMVVNDTKIYQNIKNKSSLSIAENIVKWEKKPYYNYKKLIFYKIMT